MLTWDQWAAYAVTILAGGGLGAAMTAVFKPSSRAELIKASAEAQKVAQETVTAAMLGFHAEIKRLQDRVDALEGENESCRAENWDLKQQLHSLEEILRKEGIPIPARDLPGTFVTIEGGKTTVLKPVRKRGAS